MAQRTTSGGPGGTPDNLKNFERKEGQRVIIYLALAIVIILVVGFLAGLLDNMLRSGITTNVFLDNSREILQVIASSAPWISLFIILCASWVYIADVLFTRWNRILGGPEMEDKGIIYEIVQDNNSAAALMLLLPMLLIAMGLIYVAILNLPYNLPTIVTTTRP